MRVFEKVIGGNLAVPVEGSIGDFKVRVYNIMFVMGSGKAGISLTLSFTNKEGLGGLKTIFVDITDKVEEQLKEVIGR